MVESNKRQTRRGSFQYLLVLACDRSDIQREIEQLHHDDDILVTI